MIWRAVLIYFFTFSIFNDSVALDQIFFPDEYPPLIRTLGLNNPIIRNRFTFRNQDGTCQISNREPGECLPYTECPSLIKYVAENGLQNRATIRFLRSRICRLLRNNVHLCCPIITEPLINQPSILVLNDKNNSPIIPSKDVCGRASGSRITDGHEIDMGSQPWLAGIGVPRSNGNFRVLCGGALITRRHVLTAAHCFLPRPSSPRLTHVILGEHSLSRNIERQLPIVLRITDRVSPGYDQTSQLNDIELATLERDITFTPYIRPICLPFEFQNRNLDNEPVTIVGWGDTSFRSNQGSDVPLKADINIVPKSTCRRAYLRVPQIPLDSTQICATNGTKDACQGDSGGPLIYQDLETHFRYFIIGIVSFGVECANLNYPGVYTYVPEFLEWLTENIS